MLFHDTAYGKYFRYNCLLKLNNTLFYYLSLQMKSYNKSFYDKSRNYDVFYLKHYSYCNIQTSFCC